MDSGITERNFLNALGKRVRATREGRSLTRRQVAQDAGVSERHLAQLELGEGNISILLLRRIARALDVNLPKLLIPEKRALDKRARVALIGLRGAGKTTLGSRLAGALKVPFIELDREIEQEMGMALGEIFSLYGQPGYRRIEKRVLDRVLRQHDRGVVSVAGGLVAGQDAYAQLRANCYTVWVKARPEEHMARVIAQGDLRPVGGKTPVNGKAMAELRRILESREPLYRKADAILDTSGAAVKESFLKLRSLIRS